MNVPLAAEVTAPIVAADEPVYVGGTCVPDAAADAAAVEAADVPIDELVYCPDPDAVTLPMLAALDPVWSVVNDPDADVTLPIVAADVPVWSVVKVPDAADVADPMVAALEPVNVAAVGVYVPSMSIP